MIEMYGVRVCEKNRNKKIKEESDEVQAES